MKSIPYVCPLDRDTENYYAILAFPDPKTGEHEVPICPNHKDPVTGESAVACVPVAE